MLDEEALRSRYELMRLGAGGVLLDRAGGSLYQLNGTACEIWGALISGGTTASISDDLVRSFGISREQAEQDTRATLEQLPSVPSPSAPTDPRYRWGVTPGGYGFFVDGCLTGEIDPRGDSLQMRLAKPPSPEAAFLQLKSVVPKILALRGIHILHAAAVEIDGSLLVFSGRSGAGKTTTAKTFAREGARLVSEDLLVLSSPPRAHEAMVHGEGVIRDWAAREGEALAAHPDQPIDCRALDRCLAGETRPLRCILLIDAKRRSGERIDLEELPSTDAMMALVESLFFASEDAATWRSRLESLRGLVTAVPTARATMPDSLDRLGKAVGALRLRLPLATGV